jgi:hypothetical protein
MNRRLVCVVLSCVATLRISATAAGPAVAAPDIRCPDSFSPVRASRFGDAGQDLDKNGDGWLCEKPIPAQPEGSFNVIDNNAKG